MKWGKDRGGQNILHGQKGLKYCIKDIYVSENGDADNAIKAKFGRQIITGQMPMGIVL